MPRDPSARPTAPRRWLVLAAVVAVLAAGGTAALLSSGDRPSPAPTAQPSPSAPAPTPTGPAGPTGPVRTLFGAAPEGAQGEKGYQQALARADQTLGELDVVRVYYKGAPDAWPGKAPGRNVVVSFKLPPAEVLAGAHDAALSAWFRAAPRDLETFWVFFHEPEDDIRDGAFTAEEFRAAFTHLAGLAAQAENPRLHSTLVLQSYTLKPASARNWRDYYPGDAVEVFGWDVYNRPSEARPYSDPAELLDNLRAVATSVGKPFAIAELGSVLAPGDVDGSGRARWLESMGRYLADHDARFVTYFDLDFAAKDADYRLRDAASLQAWKRIAGT